MDNTQIFDLAKKNYEEKNYEESLKYITILLDKNIQNDYLYQIAASIFFEKKEYKKALDITEKGYELYKNELYIPNKAKILYKLSDKKYYLETTILFIREVLDSNFKINDEILDIYLATEDCEMLVSKIIKLFEKNLKREIKI
jgi:predicted Zn-dependent protease